MHSLALDTTDVVQHQHYYDASLSDVQRSNQALPLSRAIKLADERDQAFS